MKKKSTTTVPSHLLKMSVDQLAAREGRKRSGAAGSHDSRPNRQRTKSAAKKAAIREFRDS